jgi:hypothetical protein
MKRCILLNLSTDKQHANLYLTFTEVTSRSRWTQGHHNKTLRFLINCVLVCPLLKIILKHPYRSHTYIFYYIFIS